MYSPALSRLKRGLRILTVANPKLAKGNDRGYATAGLHLAPAWESGHNTCAKHTPECAANCLYFSGRGATPHIQAARIKNTKDFFLDRTAFLTTLYSDIDRFILNAHDDGLIPVIRPNLTQDLPWEKYGVPQRYPALTFYDYTKIPKRKVPSNYRLIFSFSGTNLADCRTALANGMNVAVPFLNRPASWLGHPVIDGDAHDLRFLDPFPSIVALVPKGRLRRDPSSPFLGDNHPAAA